MIFPSDARGLVGSVVGHALLADVAGVLSAAGTMVMPLKGIWLQHAVYDDPSQRRITDVDLLVAPVAFARAVAVLRDAGFRQGIRSATEVALHSDRYPLPLDLHAELFAAAAFRMPASEVLRRGRTDASWVGVPLVLPDPRDALAHLVGHFVKSRGGADRAGPYLADFERIGQVLGLSPREVARHLVSCGMGRATRYAFALATAVAPGGFCAAVLSVLPPDPLGARLAAAMLGLRRNVASGSTVAALPGFVLDRSLAHGFAAATRRAADRAWRGTLRRT